MIGRLAERIAVTDDARGSKLETSGMDPVDIDQANMLIRITLANLGPRDRLEAVGR